MIQFARPFLAAVLLSLSATSAVLAQDDAGMMDCRQLAEKLVSVTPGGVEAVENGCQFTDLVADFDTYNRWHIGKAVVAGTDILAAFEAKALPPMLEVSLEDVVFSPELGDGVSQYIIEAQQVGFSAHLAYHWDEAAGLVSVDDLSLTGPHIGHGALSMRMHLEQLPALSEEGPPAGSIETLSITLDNEGLFETMMVPFLVGSLPYGDDPRPAIAKYQAAIVKAIAALPDETLDEDGKSAAVHFVESFPHPTGRYEFGFSADEPIGVAALASINTIPGLLRLLPDLTMTASHVPAE